MEGRSFVGIGLVLGLIFGVAFGIALGNPVAGGVLGVVVGLVAGFALDARSKGRPARKTDRRESSDGTVPVFVDGGGDGGSGKPIKSSSDWGDGGSDGGGDGGGGGGD